MLISKIKKILRFSFLMLFLVSLVFPIQTFAADPTITLKLEKEDLNTQTDRWSWLISINTTNVSDNTSVSIKLFKTIDAKTTEEESITEKIINNKVIYDTKNTLIQNIYYSVNVRIGDKTATFSKKTGNEPTSTSTIIYNTITPTETGAKTEENYYPLANLPGVGEDCTKDSSGKETCVVKLAPNCKQDPNFPNDPAKQICTPGLGFAGYLNIMIQIFIGIAAVLAMIMIVMGGIEYMTSELVSTKQAGKQRILNAILGLILALGSYAILNTLNPDLLNVSLSKVEQARVTIVDLPDAGDGTIDPDFKTSGGSYSTNSTISSGVTSAITKLKQGWEINMFKVYTNNRMLISLKKGTDFDNSNVIDIMPGLNNYAELGKGFTGDKKTPKGSWKILSITTAPDGKPVYNGEGANMGASFWLLSPMTNGERGIGMHGNKNGTLSKTYGCVRLKNSDILALLPYVKAGIPVNIGG